MIPSCGLSEQKAAVLLYVYYEAGSGQSDLDAHRMTTMAANSTTCPRSQIAITLARGDEDSTEGGLLTIKSA